MGNSAYDSVVEEIKRRLNIIDLVQGYVSLKRSGKGYVGLCPFHDDNNPSLHVSDEKGLFHCFSCGAGGDMFGFFMRYNNISFPEAVSELARKANINIKKSPGVNRKKSKRSVQFKLNALVSKYYENQLNSKRGKRARDYLKSRNFSPDLIKDFGLGYAPEGWENLIGFLSDKNAPLDLALDLGLIIERKSGGYYDRFRNRLIFPIRDVGGNVVGFGGRALGDDTPKYMNSPESEIYRKRSTLYGLDRAKDHIRRQEQAILVEGYTDFLALYSVGLKNVVATLGTSLTRNHARLLKRYTSRVVIIFDGDDSGMEASMRGLEVFLEEEISPLMVHLPDQYDPDSFVSDRGKEEFMNMVEGAVSVTRSLITRTTEEFREGKIGGSKAVKKITAVLEKIKDPIERSRYVKLTAEIFGMRENEIFSLIEYRNTVKKEYENRRSEFDPREKTILKIILKFPEHSATMFNKKWEDFISNNEIKTVIKAINSSNAGTPLDLSDILNRFSDTPVQETISEAVFSSDDIPDDRDSAGRMLAQCVSNLKLKRTQERLKQIRVEIRKAAEDGDGKLEKNLIEEYRDLVKGTKG